MAGRDCATTGLLDRYRRVIEALRSRGCTTSRPPIRTARHALARCARISDDAEVFSAAYLGTLRDIPLVAWTRARCSSAMARLQTIPAAAASHRPVGSGRRRPLFAFTIGRSVGRVAPSCQAVLKLARKRSIGGRPSKSVTGTAESPARRSCVARMSRNRAMGSRLRNISCSRMRTTSGVRLSAASRWWGVAGAL